ncbi:Ig-like domain-containing protein [Candidatus Viridilinea mediisalina]|uniref:Bacterial Ig domain-containing protein n=1 Tax=Candidatus Viridilinea mediisalina TaxID=2024553 RepID=A0A2A6RPM4_9CHLR|nr:Ig-like domain-containing protein [Candidatus Viridilinea mediisalina]PDW05012.1 hypothetical protein CJ255_00010 [Candidatus Viridilinea mediisalina]
MSGYQRPRRELWLTLFLVALLVSGSFGLALRPAYASTTEVIGGEEVAGTLRVTVFDDGRMNVERYSGTAWVRQVFGNRAKDSALHIAGSRYTMGGYYAGTRVTGLVNVRTDNVITSTMRAGSDVEIVQITSYTAGRAFYNLEWQITNLSENPLTDLRFFHGMDTYLDGGDNGAGWWDGASNSIGVSKVTSGIEQRMALRGLTPPHAYESRRYSTVNGSVNAGALQNEIDPRETTDNGYAMEWRLASLAPGATWVVRAQEIFLAGELLEAPVITAPTEGVTTSGRPQISGTAEPETTVIVRDANAETICEAITDADGNWSCTPETNLPAGEQAISAIADREGGVPSQPSDTRNFTVQLGPVPDLPTLESPAADSTVGLRPTFSGTAEAGSEVAVTDADGNEICSTTADEEGNWSCTPDEDLAEGPNSVLVTATNENGPSEALPRDFTAQAAPDAPTIESPASGSSVGPRPPFSGTAEPGSTVAVTDEEGNEVCTATTDAEGAWSCTPASDLPAGSTTFNATASNQWGESPAASVEVTVEHTPDAPTITSPASGSTVGPRAPFSGSAKPGSTVAVTDAEGEEVCSATTDAEGAWSCTPASDLPEGTASFSATASNAGGESPAASVEITVEHAPDAPTITSPASGSTVEPRPTFSGTAKPGSTVVVTDAEGEEVCTATTDAEGTWSCTSERDLPARTTTFSATASNAGGESPAASVEVTVEHADEPTVTSPAPGSRVDSRPLFSGTAEPGNTVVVVNEAGDEICRATTDDEGNWSCRPDRDLPMGTARYLITITDARGESTTKTVEVTVEMMHFRIILPIVIR